jgi:GH35 family endo-1,4-beta-xylanase
LIGIGVNSNHIKNSSYLPLYNRFDFWTTENELKFKQVSRGYGEADLILSGTSKPIRGHLMVSHRNVPENTPKNTVRAYFIETIRRYPQITDWDLFGEALADVGVLRNYWGRVDFTIPELVSWAREACPTNSYYYSEYNLKAASKWKETIKLVNELDLNLAIQFHHHDYGRVWLMGDWLEPLIRAVNNKSLVSEISIESISEVSQALCFNRLFKLIDKHKIDACIWNIADANKKSYLFDKNLKPKLSYFEVARYLS